MKVTVLLMLHLGKSEEEVPVCLGISEAAVRNYKQKYASKDLDDYLEDNFVAYQGKLNAEEKAVQSEELTKNVYQNTAQIVHFVEAHILASVIRVKVFFHCCIVWVLFTRRRS